MTRRARRAAQYAIVLVSLVLAAPAGAAADPGSPPAPGRRHVLKQRPDLGLRAVQIANRLTGTPYRWGGSSPQSGFDCSGLVQYVYGKLGIDLPHYAAGQFGHGRRVARGSLRPGDLVFFSGLGHVGIYAGRDRFIHAPQSGTTVRWSRLSSRRSYYGAVRLVAA
ncbi:MAG TPA: C40 family peptidase [Gaiellaceae bacterium]|jgi:cell wall-associated NlpC family hydrolase